MWMDFTFDSKKPLLPQLALIPFSFSCVLALSLGLGSVQEVYSIACGDG